MERLDLSHPDADGRPFRLADLMLPSMNAAAREDPGFAKLLRALERDPRLAPTLVHASCLASRSPSTFKRHLRLLTGRNWREFLSEWRLRNARQRLHNPLNSVKVVARSVGYGSAAAFTRAFSRRFGRTPGDYRRSMTRLMRRQIPVRA